MLGPRYLILGLGSLHHAVIALSFVNLAPRNKIFWQLSFQTSTWAAHHSTDAVRVTKDVSQVTGRHEQRQSCCRHPAQSQLWPSSSAQLKPVCRGKLGMSGSEQHLEEPFAIIGPSAAWGVLNPGLEPRSGTSQLHVSSATQPCSMAGMVFAQRQPQAALPRQSTCAPASQHCPAVQVMLELVDSSRRHDFTDIVVLHEHRGEPDGLVVCHLPYGPTAYFGLHNTVRPPKSC